MGFSTNWCKNQWMVCIMQQILRAFGRVEGSLQYLFKAWPTIIELASVYRRLREFEKQIKIKEIESLER